MEKLCDTDLTERRREGACAIAFSPDIQLLQTIINNVSQQNPIFLSIWQRVCGSNLTGSAANVLHCLFMRLREHVVLRIDAKSLKVLSRIAKQQDDSVSRIIRRAITEFLERHGQRRRSK